MSTVYIETLVKSNSYGMCVVSQFVSDALPILTPSYDYDNHCATTESGV